MTGEIWTILGVGIAIIGLGWRMYESLRQDIGGLRGEISSIRGEVGGLRGEIRDVRTEIADLRERMAKLEGLFEGYVRGDYRAPASS